MKDLTRAWVLKAEADLETANREVAVEERPNYDAVCFHAHQCAERYLKARLQQEDIPFPETNHLVVLLHLCLDLEPSWIDCIDHLRFLTSALMHVQEAEAVARELSGPVWVVKSQIHAGGRGAGHFKNDSDGRGGVCVVKSIEEVGKAAEAMLGSVLITRQTGPEGREVKRVYIEEGADIQRELYLGMLVDRANGRVTVVASTEGGMEIEEVAAKTPDKIIKVLLILFDRVLS